MYITVDVFVLVEVRLGYFARFRVGRIASEQRNGRELLLLQQSIRSHRDSKIQHCARCRIVCSAVSEGSLPRFAARRPARLRCTRENGQFGASKWRQRRSSTQQFPLQYPPSTLRWLCVQQQPGQPSSPVRLLWSCARLPLSTSRQASLLRTGLYHHDPRFRCTFQLLAAHE